MLDHENPQLLLCSFESFLLVILLILGVYGAFLLTNFWEHFSTEKEITQAKLLADVSKAAGTHVALDP